MHRQETSCLLLGLFVCLQPRVSVLKSNDHIEGMGRPRKVLCFH